MTAEKKFDFPSSVFCKCSHSGHVQGIAVDEKKGYIYFSFTTVLLKTDFSGNIIGSVKGIVGHLGCIAFDKETGFLYGTLELKHDVIGKGIINLTGKNLASEDAFYCVKFDCDKIVKEDMDAEKDEVMKAVYLPDVVCDYTENDEVSGLSHRYGCSGIDGITIGPVFGEEDMKIMIAYGIYSQTERTDNDYQIILQFDRNIFFEYEKPLSQLSPHHSGLQCEKRYFFYTGNTDFGIQNLEYDAYTKSYIAAVYPGHKKEFENYPMFFIDASLKAKKEKLIGRKGEAGLVLFPKKINPTVKDCRAGIDFPFGQTGMVAFGDGRYAFSHGKTSASESGLFESQVFLYEFSDTKNVFVKS